MARGVRRMPVVTPHHSLHDRSIPDPQPLSKHGNQLEGNRRALPPLGGLRLIFAALLAIEQFTHLINGNGKRSLFSLSYIF